MRHSVSQRLPRFAITLAMLLGAVGALGPAVPLAAQAPKVLRIANAGLRFRPTTEMFSALNQPKTSNSRAWSLTSKRILTLFFLRLTRMGRSRRILTI